VIDFDKLPKVVAIVGNREWDRESWVKRAVFSLKEGTLVVSGGAKGVDAFAETYAQHRFLLGQFPRPKIFNVQSEEWDILGKQAGHIRNEVLVNYIRLTGGHVLVFAFVDAKGNAIKSGSSNVIFHCQNQDVPYTLIPRSKENP
jgi:hypothetical protein